jgi:hypothetical protein
MVLNLRRPDMKQTPIFKTCMTAPTINNNGTSQARLLEQFSDARAAIDKAISALRETAPHGRDFMTAPEGSFEAARTAFWERMDALQEISSDLMTVEVQIARQTQRA